MAQTVSTLCVLGKDVPELSGVPALTVWVLGELLVLGISRGPVRKPGTSLCACGPLPWEAAVQGWGRRCREQPHPRADGSGSWTLSRLFPSRPALPTLAPALGTGPFCHSDSDKMF